MEIIQTVTKKEMTGILQDTFANDIIKMHYFIIRRSVNKSASKITHCLIVTNMLILTNFYNTVMFQFSHLYT